MNKTHRAVTGEPRRPLRANFTRHTLHHAKLAKKRQDHSQDHKGFFMKLPNLLQSPMAAAITVAVVAMGAVGTYAAANWFNTTIGVKTNNTVIAIDLSSCKDGFLPGFPDNQDMHNVQFKITGEPHITESDLRVQLLTMCEYNSVFDFYKDKNVDLHPAKITGIDGTRITLTYKPAANDPVSKQFQLAADATFYNQGKAITAADLQAGNNVVFATAHTGAFVLEGTDPLADVTTITSVFVAQYDTRTAPGNGKYNFIYPANNIMPLDMYNGLHK